MTHPSVLSDFGDRSFKKLESIYDYEERKKERAKRLLGSKQKNNAAISRLAQPSRRVSNSNNISTSV